MFKNNPLKELSSTTKKNRKLTSTSEKSKPQNSHQTNRQDNLLDKPFKENHQLPDKQLFQKNQAKSYLPHKLSFAIISALTIGLISGFTMLHLLSKQDESPIDNLNNETPVHSVTDSTEDAPTADLVSEEFPSLNAFTIQMGVFSERVNAEQFIELLNGENIYSVVWPKDDYFYVLIGLVPTKDEAEKLKEIVGTVEDEGFIKEWKTNSFVIDVTQEEKQWLESFINQWENTLHERDDIAGLEEQWQQLLNELPEQSSILKPFVEQIETFITGNLDNPLKIGQFLKLTWLTYINL